MRLGRDGFDLLDREGDADELRVASGAAERRHGAIAALRKAGRDPKLIGIAFSVQEVEPIPAEPHDVRLDWIVTEKETLDFRGGKG